MGITKIVLFICLLFASGTYAGLKSKDLAASQHNDRIEAYAITQLAYTSISTQKACGIDGNDYHRVVIEGIPVTVNCDSRNTVKATTPSRRYGFAERTSSGLVWHSTEAEK